MPFKYKAFWDFIFLSGGETIAKLSGFIAFSYLARVLGPESFGSLELAISLLVFFTLVMDFGYGSFAVKEIANNINLKNIYAAVIPSARLILSLLSTLLMCSTALILNINTEAQTLICIMSFTLIPSAWNQRWLLQGMELMHWISYGQILRMGLFAMCVVLFIENSADLVTIGIIEFFSVLAMVIYFLIVQYYHKVPIRLCFNAEEMIKICKNSASIGITQMLWALNQYLPTFLIGVLLDASSLAWYAAGHRIVISLLSFGYLYHFSLFPTLSRKLKQSVTMLNSVIQPSYRITAWASVFITFIVTISAEPICVFIYGKEFIASTLPLSILIWLLPIILLAEHARWVLIANNNQQYVLLASGIGTIITLIACWFLIPRYGTTGACFAVLFSQLMMSGINQYYVAKMVVRIPILSGLGQAITLATLLIIYIKTYTNCNWQIIMASILIFILLTPLFDRFVLQDIKKLSTIKNN